jgi:hypothetical protein
LNLGAKRPLYHVGKKCSSRSRKNLRVDALVQFLEGRLHQKIMQEVIELKFTVSRIDNEMQNERILGLTFCGMVLTKKSQDVVTDRLLVSEEGVRVLDVRR